MRDRSPLVAAAALAALALVVFGVLGFIPGITERLGTLSFAGRDSDAQLFGVLEVSILLNLVHLVTGLAGAALARTAEGARAFLLCGGVLFLLLWLLGMVGGGTWLPVDEPDDWVHCVVGLVMLGLGFFAASADERAPVTA